MEQLEFQFSCLACADELKFPLVFRWPERNLRICLVDVNSSKQGSVLDEQVLKQDTLMPNYGQTSSSIKPWIPKKTVSESKQHKQENNLIQPNEKSVYSALLSSFPPGCIPPPHVLAALVSSMNRTSFEDKSVFESDENSLFISNQTNQKAYADLFNTMMYNKGQSSYSPNQPQTQFALFFKMVQNALTSNQCRSQPMDLYPSLNSYSTTSKSSTN